MNYRAQNSGFRLDSGKSLLAHDEPGLTSHISDYFMLMEVFEPRDMDSVLHIEKSLFS